MLTPGWQEMLIIGVIILFVFGAKRLPEMGKSLGSGIKEFKKSLTTDYDEETEEKTEEKPKSSATTEKAEEAEVKEEVHH
jgi:sec-independent protein translocase protein TatA